MLVTGSSVAVMVSELWGSWAVNVIAVGRERGVSAPLSGGPVRRESLLGPGVYSPHTAEVFESPSILYSNQWVLVSEDSRGARGCGSEPCQSPPR